MIVERHTGQNRKACVWQVCQDKVDLAEERGTIDVVCGEVDELREAICIAHALTGRTCIVMERPARPVAASEPVEIMRVEVTCHNNAILTFHRVDVLEIVFEGRENGGVCRRWSIR